jgi:hypothetical protein
MTFSRWPGALLLLAVLPTVEAKPGFAVMPEADCQALWTKADANGDGRVTGGEAKIYIEAMTAMGMKVADPSGEKIEGDEFLKACQQGAFDNIKA